MYIAFEGIGYSGKSTQLNLLSLWLKGRDIDVTTVREPGGDPVAEKIRQILLTSTNLVPLADVFGYAAARAQMLTTVVAPSLKRGNVVLTDRSLASSCAYQGYVQKVGVKKVIEINAHLFTLGLPFPDLTFFIDVTAQTALSRFMGDKRPETDKFDDGTLQSLRLQRQGYVETFKIHPFRNTVITIDGNRSVKKVHDNIASALRPHLNGLA